VVSVYDATDIVAVPGDYHITATIISDHPNLAITSTQESLLLGSATFSDMVFVTQASVTGVRLRFESNLLGFAVDSSAFDVTFIAPINNNTDDTGSSGGDDDDDNSGAIAAGVLVPVLILGAAMALFIRKKQLDVADQNKKPTWDMHTHGDSSPTSSTQPRKWTDYLGPCGRSFVSSVAKCLAPVEECTRPARTFIADKTRPARTFVADKTRPARTWMWTKMEPCLTACDAMLWSMCLSLYSCFTCGKSREPAPKEGPIAIAVMGTDDGDIEMPTRKEEGGRNGSLMSRIRASMKLSREDSVVDGPDRTITEMQQADSTAGDMTSGRESV